VNSEHRTQLGQSGLFGSYRLFELGGADKLHISSGDKLRHRDFTISLMALSAEPSRRYQIAWPWLIAAGSTIAIASMAALAATLTTDLPQVLLWLATGLSAIASVACLGIVALRSRAERIYSTRHARVPLLALWVNQPSRDEMQRFAEHLESRIAELQRKRSLDVGTQIAGEMRMLRRLHTEGVISRDDYEKAKQILFSRSDSVTAEPSYS